MAWFRCCTILRSACFASSRLCKSLSFSSLISGVGFSRFLRSSNCRNEKERLTTCCNVWYRSCGGRWALYLDGGGARVFGAVSCDCRECAHQRLVFCLFRGEDLVALLFRLLERLHPQQRKTLAQLQHNATSSHNEMHIHVMRI